MTGEPWGRRLWLGLAAVVLAATCLQTYGIASWPMADDEVPSLVELGVLHIGAERFFSVPADQIPKLPKATPVWNAFQRYAIRLLPANELGYRVPSVVCGILTSALVFLFAARWRGLWFAVALAIVQNGSQPFVYLMQQDRFYALPLLLLTLALALMWSPRGGAIPIVGMALLTVLAVLSHNVTVAAFMLAFCAACPLFLIGRVPGRVVIRSGVAAAISLALYFFYLLPLVRGWHSTGNPTPVLVSFTAHAGIPALALALLGGWIAMVRADLERTMIWWALMLAGTFCLLLVTQMTWNPRYFLFLLPAVWVLAAHAMEVIARKVGSASVGAAWYACVALLLVPNLASHFQDGSRHDYREAAAVVAAHAQPGQPILSDDAETITYYLRPDLRSGLEVRTRVTRYPAGEFFLVCRSNVWMPTLQIPHRQMELLEEISHRRFDQFSHILRVYRVAPAQ